MRTTKITYLYTITYIYENIDYDVIYYSLFAFTLLPEISSGCK